MKMIKKFIDEVISEMKKVVWPKRSIVWISTMLVIVISIFFGVVLGLFDYGIAYVLGKLLSLA